MFLDWTHYYFERTSIIICNFAKNRKMKFKVGDIVQFIDEVGKGTVVEIIDGNQVKIEDDEGFVYPVNVSELMPVDGIKEPIENKEYESKPAEMPKEKKVETKSFLMPIKKKQTKFSAIDIVLAFVPNDEAVLDADLDLFLINDSNYSFLFQCSANIDNHYQKIYSGELEANMQLHLTTVKRTVLTQIEHFLFQGVISLDDFRNPFPLIDKTIKIKQARFLKTNAYKPSAYFDVNTIENQIFHSDFFTESQYIQNTDIEKQIKIKNDNAVKKQSKRRRDNDLIEVDLHIHEIIDDTTGLSNTEMLTIQLNHFQKELEHAIANNVRRIVFIHGKGKGVLKNAVLEKLRKEYPHLQYQDASFQEYGFGATMVLLK